MTNKPQNSFNSEELDCCNQLPRRGIITEKLVAESQIVSEESIKVLREFEEIEEDN
ncbi:hypothetical protein [Daejeonella sp.]|jgi:hypothetical protein|uniref:hypothetical protein n=1 Tax=Daejeonella sp. TaxID=2805397 RepID=UPI0037C142AE